MPTNPSLLPSSIATIQAVIHPALDWRDETLLMGAILSSRDRGVLTSRHEILRLDNLAWPVCGSAGSFSRSPVTPLVAERLMNWYGAPSNTESAYALASVPIKLAAYYRRFIVFPVPWWPDALALWTLGTYLYPIFSAYPYLRISSPEPGCGKSLLGEIIASLSFNGELMVSPTEANIFRLAESERGTQVWDEVENQNTSDQNRLNVMRGVLLNGYRAGASVPRQQRVGQGQFATTRFHVFVPRVLIGLSDLPEVVQQRTLELNLHRRSPAEPVERYRPNERDSEETELRELCALYALSYCPAVASHYRNQDLTQRLEQQLGQAGRLVDDLFLPLFAVGAACLDNDPRSRAIRPVLKTLFHEAAPAIASRWSEGATSTPEWLSAVLNVLDECGELTPTELADLVLVHTGEVFTAEQLSRKLARYQIRSIKRNGRRVFSLSTGEIEEFRARYHLSKPEERPQGAGAPLLAGETGQDGR